MGATLTDSSKTRPAPTLATAQRVAQLFVEEYGARKVLLFGSVADGTATTDSDIDLIVIYNDLDYKQRCTHGDMLRIAAREKVGYWVDLLVTDIPEWEHRTKLVRNSFEAGIAERVVPLAEGAQRPVDWGKEIGMRDSERGEVDSRLRDIEDELDEIVLRYRADTEETSSSGDGNPRSIRLRQHRLKAVCTHGSMLIEHGLKALVAMQGEPPPRTHIANNLITLIPVHLSHRYSMIPTALLEESWRWRQAGTYRENFYALGLEAQALHELAEQYSAIAVQFARQVLDEYRIRYRDTGIAAETLASACVKLETVRNRFDLWSGKELNTPTN